MVASSDTSFVRQPSARQRKIAERREATNAERETTFSVALDAYLDGRDDDGQRVINASKLGLTRTQYKQIARALVLAGRRDAALALLTSKIGQHGAGQELAPTPTAKLGDILVASWGYDQTNIDYYQVVALVGTTKVRVRKIAAQNTGRGGDYQDELMPVADSFITSGCSQRDVGDGPTGTLHAIQKASAWGKVENTERVRYCIRVASYAHAYLWDGTPSHQTASGYGH